MFKFLKKGISTPIAIAIIVLIILLTGGILVWQYWGVLKITTPPINEKELDGTPCTVGLWYDELGRACGGQRCVGLGLGNYYKGECIYSEEYRNLSKNPQIECSGMGGCGCMRECNKEEGFILSEEGNQECSVNSIYKICCCLAE